MWVKAKDIIVKSNGLFIKEYYDVSFKLGELIPKFDDRKYYTIETITYNGNVELAKYLDKEQARKVMKDFEQAIKNNETFFEIKGGII